MRPTRPITALRQSPTYNETVLPELTPTTPPTMSLSSTGQISIELTENSTSINISLDQDDLVESYRNLTDVFSHDSFHLRIHGTGDDQEVTEVPDSEEEVTTPAPSPTTVPYAPRTPSESPPPDDDTDEDFVYKMPDTRRKSF